MVEAVKRGFPQREIADAAFRYQQEVESGRAHGRRRQRLHRGRRRRDCRSCASTRRSSASRSSACGQVRARRDGARRRGRARARSSARPATRAQNLMPLAARRGPRRRHRGRDRRGAPARVRDLPRSARFSEARMQPPRPLRWPASLRDRPRSLPWPDVTSTEKKIRVVVAKPGLDGHDRGAKIIARALRDAGHGGDLHRAAPDARADRRDGDPGGRGRGRAVDPLRRAHDAGPAVMELLGEQGVDDVVVTVGGTIPADDIEELKELGVAEVFTPGALDAAGDRLHPRRRRA